MFHKGNQKNQMGLELRLVDMMNMAFLAKLVWRVLQEPKSIWSRLIQANYGDGWVGINMFKPK